MCVLLCKLPDSYAARFVSFRRLVCSMTATGLRAAVCVTLSNPAVTRFTFALPPPCCTARHGGSHSRRQEQERKRWCVVRSCFLGESYLCALLTCCLSFITIARLLTLNIRIAGVFTHCISDFAAFSRALKDESAIMGAMTMAGGAGGKKGRLVLVWLSSLPSGSRSSCRKRPWFLCSDCGGAMCVPGCLSMSAVHV